ncbi:hypothetical protein QFC24_003879 [Naganishia onofrii]|uniref:Uncharacterized protein n=1 Tax=Naganishia onofrii TaxID=1851511 RepID=A0ACC2XFN1_9TREE|nr:hypothetical protein QFC24_003879 [Naganishia onofrii]
MVLATNGGRRNWSQNTWNNAPKEEQNDCSGRGGFYIKTGTNKELCCSEKTRIPPKDIHCPRGWSQHKRNGVCVPPQPTSDCDCKEGYNWNGNNWECDKNTSPKCKQNEWYHKRSNSCLPNKPDQPGKCPTDKSCPTGWQWNTKSKKCVPKDCEAPEPDCSDWEDSTQCCHHKPTPSKKPANGGGYGTGYGTAYKRDLSKARLREADQTTLKSDEVDATFCPAPLKAWYVSSGRSDSETRTHFPLPYI